jgi:hypothetical protein
MGKCFSSDESKLGHKKEHLDNIIGNELPN